MNHSTCSVFRSSGSWGVLDGVADGPDGQWGVLVAGGDPVDEDSAGGGEAELAVVVADAQVGAAGCRMCNPKPLSRCWV